MIGVVHLPRMVRRSTSYGPMLQDGVLEDDGADRMPEQISRIVPIAALTGAREGELFALRVEDVDFADETLLVVATGSNPRGQVKSIAEQLGHTDGGVLVLRRYGHLFKGTRRQAALALDEYVRASDGARAADRERAETRPTAH